MKCELARGAAAPAAGAVPRRAHHRPRRLDAGHGARLHPRPTTSGYGATVLLTSHYMDDVAALCPRVIVIDHGRLRLRRRPRRAGALDPPGQAHRASSSSARCDRAALEALGAGGRARRRARAVLQVPERRRCARRVARCWRTLPVVDLTVEDPPLEEVMRELFARAASGRREPPREADRRVSGLRRRAARVTRRCSASASPRRSPTAPRCWSGCSPPPCRS